METVIDIDRFETVEDLEARFKEVKERITTLDAEHGTRAIKGTEAEAEWNDLNAEHDAIEVRLEELAKRKARLERVAEDENRMEHGSDDRASVQIKHSDYTWDMGDIRRVSSSAEDYARRLRDNALHFVEMERFQAVADRGISREKAQGHVAHLLDTIDGADPYSTKEPSELARRILMTGNPSYGSALRKYIVGAALTTEEQNQLAMVQRALNTGGASGGYALVYTLDPTVVPTSNSVVNPWRALARNETISGTNEWKAVTSGAITAAYGAEALETTDNAPALAQPDIIVEKAQAFVPFSIEIGQDWGQLDSEMATLFQDAKDDLESAKFATGAGHGSTEPKGVLTGATNTTGTTTTAAFVIADLYKLIEALPPRFRPRAQFAANLFIIDKVRQFDTSGGSGVFIGPQGLQPQADAGQSGSVTSGLSMPLFGRRFWEASSMGAALTTTTKIMIAGDWRYFVIVDRVGLNVEVVPTLFGTANNYPTGQRGLYAYWRNSSDVLSAAAFRVLVT